MKIPMTQRDDRTIQVLQMISLLAAFLYIVFGLFIKYVLDVADPIPLAHRLVFALCFGGLAGFSYISSLVRKHMALLIYALGCAAVLNLLLMATEAGFDAGSIVALLLVVPLMNFLFYRWKFLLYANASMFLAIVSIFTASSAVLGEVLVFVVSSAAISGVSFWFTRRLLLTEAKSARNEQLFRDLFQNSNEGIAIHEMVYDPQGRAIDYVFVEVNPTFETYTGLQGDEILGKRVTEVLPGIEQTEFIETYGRVVSKGASIRFERFSEPLQRRYQISAYPLGGNRFAAAFEDITEDRAVEREQVRLAAQYEAVFQSTQDAMFVVEVVRQETFRFIKNNPAHALTTGIKSSDMYGKTPKELVGEELGAAISSHYERCVQERQPIHYEQTLPLPGGARTWSTVLTPLIEEGQVSYIVGSSRDITDRKRDERELQAANAVLDSIIENIPSVMLFLKDAEELKFVRHNKAAEAMLGISRSDLYGKTDYDFFSKEQADFFTQNDREVLRARKILDIPEEPIETTRGERILHTVKVPILDDAGEPEYLLGISEDITERKEAAEALRLQQQHFIDLMEDSLAGYWDWDLANHSEYLSPAFKKMFGYEDHELTNAPETWQALIFSEDLPGVIERFDRYIQSKGKEPFYTEVRYHHKDGSIVWVICVGRVVAWDGDRPLRMIGCHIDITEQKQAVAEIQYLGLHDTLTGLYNRRFYEAEFQRLDVPENLSLAILIIDVNGLKLTNDAFGHAAGDKLLQTVAEVLRQTFRQDDIVARVGGDEFAVLLPNTDKTKVRQLTKRVHRAMRLKTVEGLPLSVACGWAAKTNRGEDMHAVFKEAEDHMYRNKVAEQTSHRYQTIQLIVQTIYAKSPREQQHAQRVRQLCAQIGAAMGLNQSEIHQLSTAGELHDIGKIAVDNEILDKKGPLSDSEWEQIKRHPQTGHSILSAVNDYGPLAESVLAHHERWDGSGYPNGWRKEEIPRIARIISVADAYDAMTSNRPYRSGMSGAAAMVEIRRCSGSQFDPAIATVFLNMMTEKEGAASDDVESAVN